jgi:uncharacterized protein (DUF1015 family)
MVKIIPIHPYIPLNPEEFCIKPYDVIEPEEELELKKKPNCCVHLSLPEGDGDQKYQNGARAFAMFKARMLIKRLDGPGIFVYRQESSSFAHQGFILGVSLEDYNANRIVKHEHTREKPLQDRMKHVMNTHVMPGLVWTVFRSQERIKEIMEEIKSQPPLLSFPKYGYQNLLWYTTDASLIAELTRLFDSEKLYIADGHHRAASAALYRKRQLEAYPSLKDVNPIAPWQFLMSYVASDDQIRILPYNRIIKKLPLSAEEFLTRLAPNFEVIPQKKGSNPLKKHTITMCLSNKWYTLQMKSKKFPDLIQALDVSILQNLVIEPILGIKDIRSDENIFFVGGIVDPKEMEKYVISQKNAIFFNLYPVDIRDLEAIADNGGVMPPKSTWFDPKLLSGLLIYPLQE